MIFTEDLKHHVALVTNECAQDLVDLRLLEEVNLSSLRRLFEDTVDL